VLKGPDAPKNFIPRNRFCDKVRETKPVTLPLDPEAPQSQLSQIVGVHLGNSKQGKQLKDSLKIKSYFRRNPLAV